MDARSLYEIWAPPNALWSPWAKPVLFAHIPLAGKQPAAVPPQTQYPPNVPKPHGGRFSWIYQVSTRSSSAWSSHASGFDRCRCLTPVRPRQGFLMPRRVPEVVPVTPMLSALIEGAVRLELAGLAEDAAQAFLLDANRLGGQNPIDPGWFDNRSVLFATDLPSAKFLFEHRITSVQVIHRGALAEDLLDVLRDWNRQGMLLAHLDLEHPGAPIPLVVPPTWRLGLSRLARRLWALASLRRNPRGGYGGFVPEPGSSGG